MLISKKLSGEAGTQPASFVVEVNSLDPFAALLVPSTLAQACFSRNEGAPLVDKQVGKLRNEGLAIKMRER
jgi:hypothetical protein